MWWQISTQIVTVNTQLFYRPDTLSVVQRTVSDHRAQKTQMKNEKALGETQTLRAGRRVVTLSQKFSPCRCAADPFLGAQDRQNLMS